MLDVQNSVAKSQADSLFFTKKKRRPVGIVLNQADRTIQRFQLTDGNFPSLLFIHTVRFRHESE
jgi:hypothetical protein